MTKRPTCPKPQVTSDANSVTIKIVPSMVKASIRRGTRALQCVANELSRTSPSFDRKVDGACAPHVAHHRFSSLGPGAGGISPPRHLWKARDAPLRHAISRHTFVVATVVA